MYARAVSHLRHSETKRNIMQPRISRSGCTTSCLPFCSSVQSRDTFNICPRFALKPNHGNRNQRQRILFSMVTRDSHVIMWRNSVWMIDDASKYNSSNAFTLSSKWKIAICLNYRTCWVRRSDQSEGCFKNSTPRNIASKQFFCR